MKKVLFVANEDTHLHYFHMNDIRLLEELGFTVDIAALRGTYTEAIEEGRRVYHNIHFSRKPLGKSNLKAFFELLKLMKNDCYTMVHVHNVVASIMTRLAAKLAGVKTVVYTAHGFPFHPCGGRLKNFVFQLIEKIMGWFTDYLIVMNDWDWQMARKKKIVPPGRLFRTNGVGVDLSRFNFSGRYDAAGSRRAFGIRDGVKVVGCVAELIPRKNHRMIIEAASDIVRQYGDVVFLLVGGGSYRAKLEEMITEKGLKDYFVFTGRIDDIPRALSMMDILLLVSVYEGLPRAIQEGMAMGLPVVASNIRGNADLVNNGVNGYLVALDDARDLADKVLRLLKDEALREAMGANNRRKIENEYSLTIVEGQMRHIYSKILGLGEA